MRKMYCGHCDRLVAELADGTKLWRRPVIFCGECVSAVRSGKADDYAEINKIFGGIFNKKY